jgi:hypothetical protein
MKEINQNQYTLAGWLAIVSAVLFMPELILAVLAEFFTPELKIIVIPIHIVNVIIGVYILYMFRRLLNQLFDFHAVDVLINILIVVNIIFFSIGMVEMTVSLMHSGGRMSDDISILVAVLFVPYSIIMVVFGAVLLKMKDDLFGLLKPFAYTTILSGVCGATIILSPVAMLAAIATLVMQGMIFLRAKREVEIL